jgi:cellulose synthase/poly-beta-1,6-N-acetylglucosamine synthase-like glycosyltransferase
VSQRKILTGSILGLALTGAALLAAIVAILIFHRLQRRSIDAAPSLDALTEIPASLPSVTVIIPAYNEATNIRDCVAAVLASDLPDPQRLQLIVADDESEDDTAAIATQLSQADPRVQVLSVPPRPQDTPWRGKNWACANAVEQATGDYWLFIDADVRLEPIAIATALTTAEAEGIDLLSFAPNIRCGCLSEWLVQPIMMGVIAIGFDFQPVNDPKSTEAFAAGPFMLFRASAYKAVGGHRAVAADLVEDVALARQIKGQGFKLRYTLALDLVAVRMYQSFGPLWEGWTKNYYMGTGRNLGATLYSAFALSLVFVVPWVGLAASLGFVSVLGIKALPLLGLAVFAVGLQYQQRLGVAKRFQQPLRYGWLGGVGGAIVVAIALVSIIKTETGWGWTWRGRSLAG